MYLRDKLGEMVNIHKIYPDGTVALRGVNLDIYEGEMLGLLGENGAGKTTLMKILSGLLKPTRGVIRIKGKEVKFRSPKDALSYGIGMVHQHFTLVPQFTVLENIVLGSEPKVNKLMIDWSRAEEEVKELMKLTGFKVDLNAKVASLPVGMKQMAEILKVLYRNIRLLILDEPTSALTPIEVKSFFNVLRKLREGGVTIVFITHKIKEALEITDRIVVLRKGLVEGVISTTEATPQLLARMMVKVETKPIIKPEVSPSREVLVVEDLWVRGDDGRYVVKGASFCVREGEIYGILGVEGNGQKELVEAIIGLRRYDRGRVLVRSNSRLLAYVPPDRTTEGLVLEMPVCENSILGIHKMFTFGKLAINTRKVVVHANELVSKYSIATPNIRTPAKYLSGGNQQRLVIARELSKGSDLLIVVNPTRGLDIASTNYVRKLLVDLRSNGKAILLVTADVDEALEISDRLGVIYNGRITGEDLAMNFTEERLGLLMGGALRE
ncbi:MAG: ABC transporter ATP-binding protein [Zestosphaera tikiterensis]|uniref:ABC transporter ATP-binding protein n=1 Tax=Zestosphaera tikiterensis TaxID=1973259 RepID=A0A2R7Y218_9CREN|nr:MAG: ABC transporter ATP-binding protein [Zestosphaera tikiterensis]